MHRGILTSGVAVSRATLTLANALTDYSYVTARNGDPNGVWIARCLTGLGPTSTSNGSNGVLGGLYFNDTMIPNSGEYLYTSCSSDVFQVRPGTATAGVINVLQCEPFSTSEEGVYTCTMMNSSMMNQSVRFGVYFTGRSERLVVYISSLNHLSPLSTQLLQ